MTLHSLSLGSLNNEKEEEIPSFQNCVFSSLFLTHLLWFSVIQLRFILFIGTINPMLDFLADGDPGQGKGQWRRGICGLGDCDVDELKGTEAKGEESERGVTGER